MDRTPADGELSARRGYRMQDRAGARRVRKALLDGSLEWVEFASRKAGILDDFVLGYEHEIHAYQIKSSAAPKRQTAEALLIGSDGALEELAASFKRLRREHHPKRVVAHYVTEAIPAAEKLLVPAAMNTTTADFVRLIDQRSMKQASDWLDSDWAPFLHRLSEASSTSVDDLSELFANLKLVMGRKALDYFGYENGLLDGELADLTRRIADLVLEAPNHPRWTRRELLDALGWRDQRLQRFDHEFPIEPSVQSNQATSDRLVSAIDAHGAGYLALVGGPGTGKSTLLQQEIRSASLVHVVRYLAFLPERVEHIGRGEAESFLRDLIAQLLNDGLSPLRMQDESVPALLEHFEHLLGQAAKRFVNQGLRTVVVVDGLDHIPREQNPVTSLISVLPRPVSVPDGVLFVLGTQSLELDGLALGIRTQLQEGGRRVDVAPLSERTTKSIARGVGIEDEGVLNQIHSVAAGHPLATRYLLNQLVGLELPEQQEFLRGQVRFEGDLNVLYTAARDALIADEQRGVKVLRVLATLARCDEAARPQLLARLESEQAVEDTLRRAGHLLKRTRDGLRIFHNSLRLFLQDAPVPRYGDDDPEYSSASIYRRLADVCEDFEGAQRWLRLRYLILAGEVGAARGVASRRHFIAQFIEGRSAAEIQRDISLVLRSLNVSLCAEELFELVLTSDELGRREWVCEECESAPSTYLALGDVSTSIALCHQISSSTMWWEYIRAVMESGEVEAARSLFDESQPLDMDSHSFYLGQKERRYARSWAALALEFLSERQIRNRVEFALEEYSGTQHADSVSTDDVRSAVQLAVAEAIAFREPERLQSIMSDWLVEGAGGLFVALRAADGALRQGSEDLVLDYLCAVSADESHSSLHASWLILAGQLAMDSGDSGLARQFASAAAVADPFLEPSMMLGSRSVEAELTTFADWVSLRGAVGLDLPATEPIADVPLRGLRVRTLRLAALRGSSMSGEPALASSVSREFVEIMRLVAKCRRDGLQSYDYRKIVGAAQRLAMRLAYETAEACEEAFDGFSLASAAFEAAGEDIVADTGFFRELTMRQFQTDGMGDVALRRLERGIEALESRDAWQFVDERGRYARELVRVGNVEGAHDLLRQIRRDSLIVVAAPKKDPQYEMWADVLRRSGGIDSSVCGDRASVLLKHLSGLQETEGYGMVDRIVAEVCYEVGRKSPRLSWSVGRFCADEGLVPWGVLVDSLCGCLADRGQVSNEVIASIWCCLALPWFEHGYSSTARGSVFLSNLDARSVSELRDIEVVRLIEVYAIPGERLELLNAIAESGGTSVTQEGALEAVRRWRQLENLPESRMRGDSVGLSATSIAELLDLVKAEKDAATSNSDPSFGLAKAAERLISRYGWTQVKPYVESLLSGIQRESLRVALAESAIAAGDQEAAREILKPFLEHRATKWDWYDGLAPLRRYRALAIVDRESAAQMLMGDLVSSWVQSGRVPYGAAWHVCDFLSLMYSSPNWVSILDRLVEQHADSVEHRLGAHFQESAEVESDRALLARILAWAVSLGFADVFRGGERCFLFLMNGDGADVALEAIDVLLAGQDDDPMLGASLLLSLSRMPAVEAAFRQRLPELVSHPDAAVVAVGLKLGATWSMDVELPGSTLSPFYSLTIESGLSSSVLGESSRSISVGVERAFGVATWLRGTISWLSSTSGIAESILGARCLQFFSTMGGEELLSQHVSRGFDPASHSAGLILPGPRMAERAIARAARFVVGELFLGKRLSVRELRSASIRLGFYPSCVGPVVEDRRPSGLLEISVFDSTGSMRSRDWVDGVSEDLQSLTFERLILAEYMRFEDRRTFGLFVSEGLVAPESIGQGAVADVLDLLPDALLDSDVWPFYEASSASASGLCRTDARNIFVGPRQALTLCPLLEAELGWRRDPADPFRTIDSEGREMARTEFWRDGVAQSQVSDGRYAFGVRVVLSLQAADVLSEHLNLSTRVSVTSRLFVDNDGESSASASAVISAS